MWWLSPVHLCSWSPPEVSNDIVQQVMHMDTMFININEINAIRKNIWGLFIYVAGALRRYPMVQVMGAATCADTSSDTGSVSSAKTGVYPWVLWL